MGNFYFCVFIFGRGGKRINGVSTYVSRRLLVYISHTYITLPYHTITTHDLTLTSPHENSLAHPAREFSEAQVMTLSHQSIHTYMYLSEACFCCTYPPFSKEMCALRPHPQLIATRKEEALRTLQKWPFTFPEQLNETI